MYEYLKGIITKITAKYIVLEVETVSVISRMWPIPMPTQDRSIKKLKSICIKLYVRMLICFMVLLRRREKLFLSLISVSGIGPVSALAIIAADDNAGLVQAIIETKNITYLTKFPKIERKQPNRWCWT